MSTAAFSVDLNTEKNLRVGWQDDIQKVNEELQRLNSSSEEQFLAIGEKLHYYSSTSRKISEMAIEAANFLSGDEAQREINDLQSMLDRIQNYLSGSSAELNNNKDVIKVILDKADEIDKSLLGFKNLVKSLRVIGISTQMELSRIKNTTHSFDTLIEDVKSLSHSISVKSESIGDKLASLKNTANEKLAQISGLQETHLSQQSSILESARSCLSSLTNKRMKSSEIATQVSEKSNQISKSIAAIVTTVQVHDMVRQIIEHVQEALDEVRNKWADENDDTLQFADVANICHLQIMQLQSALEKINGAANGIKDNLNGIGRSVSQVSLEIQSMNSSSNDNGTSIVKCKERMENIGVSLEDTSKVSADLKVAMKSITQESEEISELVNDMGEVELEIKLVSINGLINAMHLGDEGASLTVLADEIKNHSLIAHEHIKRVDQIREDIVAEVHKNDEMLQSETDQNDNTFIAEINSKLIGFSNYLNHTSHNIDKTVNPLSSAVSTFENDLQLAVESISVHSQFSTVLQPIIDDLETLKNQAREMAGNSDFQDASESMDLLKLKYTMDKEREVHQEYVEAEFFGVEQNSNEVIQSEAELEDNIELF